MSETQTITSASAPPIQTEIEKLVQDLASAASALQSVMEQSERGSTEPIRYILPILKHAQQSALQVEARLQQCETKLKEAQQDIQGVNELQTLLDILPVGIIISHDPQNQHMTINRMGLKMLNLHPDTNPSKSAPGGDQLPFKVFRTGQELPPEELPIQYAAAHKVALRDVELEVKHANGKSLNLLEYASPLYDEQGAVRGSLGVMVDITSRKSVEQRLVMQYQIARVLAESNSINGAAAQVLRMICETAGWEYGALWRVEPDTLTLRNEGVWHTEGVNLSEYAEAARYSVLNGDGTSLPGYVYHTGQSLYLSSLEDFHIQDVVDAEIAGLRSAFLLPVRSSGKVIAILECLSTQNQVQDQNLTHMLNAVSNQIGIFLERKMLEEALAIRANQQQLLAQAGMALSNTLDYVERLQTIVQVIVPDLADWCAIDIIDQNNILHRAAAAHVDPEKEQLVYKLQPTRPADPKQAMTPQAKTLLTGKSLLYTDIPQALLEELIVDPEMLEIINQLAPVSSIVVPMIAHDHILGICTLVQSDSGRHYASTDLSLAEDIVQRTALALDNAFLYEESQKLNIELERRVDVRTAELKMAINQVTNQMVERQHAENEVRKLNAELEQRIADRTFELERTNRELNKEVLDHLEARQALDVLLKQTRELYRISQTMGAVRTPNELLSLLLSSSYLKDASRASIAILDKPWLKDGTPPESCFILAEWNRGRSQPRYFNRQFTLEEYGLTLPIPYGQPIFIQDIQSVMSLPEPVRKRFADLKTHSLIILPLMAGGEWYGLLSLHFKTNRMTNKDDLRHMRGLVNGTSIAIKNMRLLEAESQARHEAEEANELKLKFLAMISHELRTPLTPIKGFATTLLAEDVVWSPENQRTFLQIISRESDKLSDLIEQLLNLSRIKAGNLRISPKKLPLSSVINSALDQLQALTAEHELVLDVPTELPPIFGDDQRIAQVLTNLVGNSAKFSPAQTQITISAHRSGEMVQVDVADQGPGIPQKDRARVFEAFRQLENGTDNLAKGAGLGLAICKGLIEAQGGNIWIQDQPIPGTIISFTLPVYRNKKNRDTNE